MNKAKELQKQHEKWVSDNLLKTLNVQAAFTSYGDDRNQPDVIYLLDGKRLGIEVATAYYDDSDAKQAWTLARGERTFPVEGFEPRWGGAIWEPDKTMAARIQSELEDKCSKQYSDVDYIWLCVEERAPLSDQKAVDYYLSILSTPKNHCFDQIYLLHLSPVDEQGKHVAFKIGE